ncbi:MAG: GTPase, family [Frankiales bacterium]|nr:GTPase, family [Frankiales bacterium]
MTVLGLPALGAPPLRAGGRRQVTLLSGFLGSGKTTLLREELSKPGVTPPAVILNDFGQAMVDDLLLDSADDSPVVVSGGCGCCTRRGELARALAEVLDAEQRGLAPTRDHVIIETSGLSDPGPIAFTVAQDPVLKHHFALARICVTVDALTGLHSIEQHPVAMRQLLAADDVLVTKADLAGSDEIEHLVSRLRQLNPSAGVSVTAKGQLLRVVLPPIVFGKTVASSDAAGDADAAHVSSIRTLELVTAERLDWQAFAVWLSLLLDTHGPQVLRVKGILDVEHVGPVVVNGVQHVIHRPEHLNRSAPPGTRLVLIVQDIDTALLERSFHTFLNI